ncbi:MAG: dolichol-phosphate mannosyltransferase, partial [Candidatus Poribacteria bacterium]|nr:dolichol-phosphate mannosyltransferase [Candidatus Poribacteria bacterium]
ALPIWLLNSILCIGIPEIHIVPVMDSYSKDDTYDIVNRMSKGNPNIHLLFHEKSKGVVSCYLYGFKYALQQNADYIIEMDGGCSHDPKEIPNFIKYLDEGYDCVFSSRFMTGGGIENHPLYRRLVSKYGTILANLVLGTKLSDMTSGYEAFRREVLEKIDLDNMLSINISHFYQTEMRYYCSKFNIYEIPITYKGSKSSLKSKTVFKSLRALFILKKRGIALRN